MKKHCNLETEILDVYLGEFYEFPSIEVELLK